MTRILTIACVLWLEMIRRKDIYVLLILLGAILGCLVSLDVFGLGGVVSYVMDIGLLMAWVFGWILAINIGSREIPQEEARGTIFHLLAKPVARFEFVFGKWLGAWSIVCASVFLFYALIIAVVLGKHGTFNLAVLSQAYILHCAALAVLTAVALAFSTRMNHDAAASISFVLTAASFLVVPRIPEFMANEMGLRADLLMFLYNLLPHFEIFDMRMRVAHGYGPISWQVFTMVFAYGMALTAFFVLAGWVAYRNKRFSRGSQV